MEWNKDVRYIKGVGEKIAKKLSAHLGIGTLEELLFFPPTHYLDRTLRKISELKNKQRACIKGVVEKCVYMPRRLNRFEAVIRDDSGTINAVWFGRKYAHYTVKKGLELILSGKTGIYKGRFNISVDDFSVADISSDTIHFGRIVPHYPLPEQLRKYTKRFRTIMNNALKGLFGDIPETLPPWIVSEYCLIDLGSAIRSIHFPSSIEQARSARNRLVYEEAYYLFLAIELTRKRLAKETVSYPLNIKEDIKERIISDFPFKLTEAQNRVIDEISLGLSGRFPMYRLLQGDVGSGKTVVSFFCLAMSAFNNYQAALMAPTEILAEQHYSNFRKIVPGINAVLLTSSTPKRERKKIVEMIKDGSVNIVIGTHTLFQKDVQFKSLSVAVIDEQHKFGVLQREAMVRKGYNPHVLVMTATPIPRSLALTLFADADISVLKQLPPGRKAPLTSFYFKNNWEDCLGLIRGQLDKGRQAYFVYPLIEQSEKIQATSAKEMYVELKKIFPGYEIELVHGKMKKDERENIMNRFRNNEIHLLVSTIVIEIGVDVPNATVMVIDNAERFGLSQLHQLRGRIVRSDKTPYCILIGIKSTEEAKRRFEIMLKTTDGFKIAEEDLKIRGPGEFIGREQKGFARSRFLNFVEDMETLVNAKQDAAEFVKKDPNMISNWGKLFEQRLKHIYKDKIHLSAIV